MKTEMSGTESYRKPGMNREEMVTHGINRAYLAIERSCSIKMEETEAVDINAHHQSLAINVPGSSTPYICTRETGIRKGQILSPKPTQTFEGNSIENFGSRDDRSSEMARLEDNSKCYSILLAKKNNKKHKTWEEDGVLIIDGKTISVVVDGIKKSSSTVVLPKELIPGVTEFTWEGKLVQVGELLPPSTAGKNFPQTSPRLLQTSPMEEENLEAELFYDSKRKRRAEQIDPEYYSISIGKRTTKKHKTWEEDGTMIIQGTDLSIRVGNKTKKGSFLKLPKNLVPGETQFIWEGKVVMVQEKLSEAEVREADKKEEEQGGLWSEI